MLGIFLGRSVRLSEYVYKPHENSTGLCYPEGFQWRRNVTVSMVVTGNFKNSSIIHKPIDLLNSG